MPTRIGPVNAGSVRRATQSRASRRVVELPGALFLPCNGVCYRLITGEEVLAGECLWSGEGRGALWRREGTPYRQAESSEHND